MAHLKNLTLPIPEPLRGSEIGSFAHDTIVRRLPDIVRRTINENDFSTPVVKDLQKLIDEIPAAQIRPLEDAEAPDAERWDVYVEPYKGWNWLEVPWFFAEFYLYRRILEATGYFRAGGIGYLRDPYVLQKHRGLETAKDAMQSLCSLNNQWALNKDRGYEAIITMLLIDLWGNKADLSLWPAGDREQEHFSQKGEDQERVVVNHSIKLVEYLYSLDTGKARIDLLLDNAGFELIADLCFTDFLLSTDFTETVFLHPKTYPVFVSDALIKDVDETIAFMESQSSSTCGLVGKRLREYFQDRRLIYRQDNFWTSPLTMWEMPAKLRTDLEGSDLAISKGDANYRRLLGDRRWTFTTNFGDIMSYFPAPLLALRACKSDVICGLVPGQAEVLTEKDPNWMTNGQWGVIQFSK